jgi:ferrous iron transport protein A
MATLQDLKKGVSARIISIDSDSDMSQRLQEMGLTTGTEFRVVKVAPLGDPVEIDVRGYRLCLRKQEMSGFNLEVVA